MSRFTVDALVDIDTSNPDKFDQICEIIERVCLVLSLAGIVNQTNQNWKLEI
jgi:hypothetical protein